MSEKAGAWIKARREQLELSQDQLAARMQVHGVEIGRAAISHWESGRNPLPLNNIETIKALAGALEVSVSELLVVAGYEEIIGEKLPLDESERQILSALRRGEISTVLEIIAKRGIRSNPTNLNERFQKFVGYSLGATLVLNRAAQGEPKFQMPALLILLAVAYWILLVSFTISYLFR